MPSSLRTRGAICATGEASTCNMDVVHGASAAIASGVLGLLLTGDSSQGGATVIHRLPRQVELSRDANSVVQHPLML
jgi:hypothetical protein